MTETTHKPVRLFFSYSHKDERYLDRLKTHLIGLSRQGLVEEWHDRKLVGGQEWDKAIDENLQASEIILLLVTPDFMRSEYVSEKEIKKAIEKHERGEARVIPIIVRPADWQWAPFGQLQALPKDAKPITEWSNRDRAWLDVIRGIRKAVEELMGESSERGAREERQEIPRPAVEDTEPEEPPSWERERETEGPTDRVELTSLHQYREEVQVAWANGQLHGREAERLRDLANELGLSADTTTSIEREVIGEPIEAIRERQERAARERNKRLEELYTRARRLHRDRRWHAVVDIFEQIHSEDPAYPDPEGLLMSAREALDIAQKKEDTLRQYLEGVESAWADGELDRREVETLRDLADKLEVSPSNTAKIEREIMGDTREAILESQERAANERYREAVEEAWADKRVSDAEAERLGALANELGLSMDTGADIEHRVIGATKEELLGRQKGTVKWFSEEEGYGFISPDDGSEDVFVYLSGKAGSGLKSLEEDAKVTYEVRQGRTGSQATDVRRVDPPN